MERATAALPGGSTRSFGFWEPYPVVIDRADGSRLVDVDGNSYIDLIYNGLSLIHGHAFPPVRRAIHAAMTRGSAWPGSSVEQIAFAEALRDRIACVDLVRFANTGTEAAMLAMKVARRATGRPLVLKAWAGYHGSYDDLEAGLGGEGELPGRTLLATFGDAASFEAVLAERGHEIAAVVLEPVMFTGIVVPPSPDFLERVQDAAHRAGALFVIDDCLMFRLAHGGSAERFGLDPDLVFLGKFIGGGLPVGAVGGRKDVMQVLDPRWEGHLYHGGSFNGNLLGSVAGLATLEHLTAQAISDMDTRTSALREGLVAAARAVGLPASVAGVGSAFGFYLAPEVPDPIESRPDAVLASRLHVAALNRGVYMGSGGEIALATVVDDETLAEILERLADALADVAANERVVEGVV